MIITLDKPNKLIERVNYVVKYIVKNTFSFKEYYLKDNLYSKVKDDYNILSTWRNEREYDNSFDYIYYYMIHPTNLNYFISICTPSETIFAEMTNKTELLWMNSKKVILSTQHQFLLSSKTKKENIFTRINRYT